MKELIKKVTLFLAILSVAIITGQEKRFTDDDKGLQLSARVGYDMFPSYDNNTPHVGYNGGIDLGVSADYYWHWLGVGADFDYIKNKAESVYTTSNLADQFGVPFTDFFLSEDDITRIFYGIGPNFRYLNSSTKLQLELNTRVGLARIYGGRTLLEGQASTRQPLNFHAGYDQSSVFSAKGQFRGTYWLSENFGLHAGMYYMHHFNVEEQNEAGASAFYHDFSPNTDTAGNQLISGGESIRASACSGDISSIGSFIGVTYKFGKKKNKTCPVCETDHTPHCCSSCNYSVTVTAKDKFTSQILPNTDVVLTDLDDQIVQSGTTNSYGTVVFQNVKPGDYNVRGKLYDVKLEENVIILADFKASEKNGNNVQKEILYGDKNFILKGVVVECNNTKGIPGVDVMLKDQLSAKQKNTLSGSEGVFNFHLKQASKYLLTGKKDGYFSNETAVDTKTYDRNKDLFIDFEMCIDPCGIAIKLDNINFNLDEAIILPSAKSDLNYIVNLMNRNTDIMVEMSSHTDSQGSDSYNQDLSQRRADASVDYIVSQGISRNRLIARGAGETELKNTKCSNNVSCTDEEHRVNRRTEFKVICP